MVQLSLKGKQRIILKIKTNNYFYMEYKETLTIILAVISIFIAIWSSRSTSKAAAKQIESLKQLVEKQGQEIEEIKNLSSLLVKSDIETLNIEILRLNTELAGMEIEIRQLAENENSMFRPEVRPETKTKEKEQHDLLVKKKELLVKHINTLQKRKDRLEKGAKE